MYTIGALVGGTAGEKPVAGLDGEGQVQDEELMSFQQMLERELNQ